MNLITITTPKQIDSKAVKNAINKLILSGAKTNEIWLQMNFICDDPKAIIDKFRVLKNTAAFERDMKNGKFKNHE